MRRLLFPPPFCSSSSFSNFHARLFSSFILHSLVSLSLTLRIQFPPLSPQPSPARCAEISRAQQQQGGGSSQHPRSSLHASSSGRADIPASSTAAAACSSASSLLPFLPPRPLVDPIDAGDVGDTLACVEYVQDIMESLYDSEVRGLGE